MPGSGNEYRFVVRHISADYETTSNLSDMLTIKSFVTEIKNSSFTLLQETHKNKQKIFSMKIVFVYVENGIVVKIPEYFRDLLNSI